MNQVTTECLNIQIILLGKHSTNKFTKVDFVGLAANLYKKQAPEFIQGLRSLPIAKAI